MAGSEPATSPSSCQEAIFPWLRSLPVAPEYHPTVEEFQDPISYIFKIEKEASKYGICKIVPPVLPPPRKALARSIRAFATRSQQVGFSPRPGRPPVQRPVWQSGEEYTFREFETKAKVFEKMYLRKVSKRGAEKGAFSLSPLEIETLYWKATVDKPFSVEYANDMPGSAFPLRTGDGVGPTVAETEWNMRGVSRANGSLLRFMKEEIPGVTSPMVYVAMMFSWFAWHVEDHDFHSLNYLHSGAGKTWYGVPREAASAFEEVVRVHGYGGEINPLVMFAVLGEKTTVMSPEVIVGAGVPCCRLVQNPGEFVVTFPRAYHSGFSHGFNCGEAANIATPEWLTMAKDAAIRRASINYPPMVSHLQLLYDLALEQCSRLPVNISSKPRSSRLKDKQKGEGETLVKAVFMKSMQRNNELLHVLGKGSAVVLLPQSSLDASSCSNLRIGSQPRVNPSHGLSSNHGLQKFSNGLVSHDSILGRSHEIDKMGGYFYMKQNFPSLYEQNGIAAPNENESISAGKLNTLNGDKSNQRLFSCVKCGILCFDCVAILQPREAAARYLMSADCSFLNDWITGSGAADDGFVVPGGDASTDLTISCTRSIERRKANVFYAPIEPIQKASQSNEMASGIEAAKRTSALGLLALTYGNSSDSEDDQVEADVPTCVDEIGKMNFSSEEICYSQDSGLASLKQEECPNGSTESCAQSLAVVTSHYQASPKEMETSSMSIQRSFEDTSRMHVFCLEHAVEVEQQLRQIGGVHMLLFCHPDYPRIEDKAKVVSKELGIVNQWNEFCFKEATKVDEDVIQIALDSEEAIPGNGDWTVKLGINLFYSANLSWSPLYSKQMPYNAVMYDAFGRTSPASSSSDIFGRRSVRQKKVVAGKWCGKVWMSNQVHPFLTNQESEENAPELEREMSFRDWARPDEKSEKKPWKHPTRSGSRRIVNKKKMAADSRSIKQLKSLTTESVALFESEDISCKQYSRTHNKKKTKYMGRRILNDLLGEKNHKQSVRSPDSNQSKSIDGEDAVSDDLSEDNAHRQNSWTPGTRHANFDTVKRVSHKRRRSVSGRTKLVKREAAVSDSSLEDSVPDGRVGRNRAKHTESEDSLSDGSLDETSHQLLGRAPVGEKVKYIEDDIASDDSLEDSSYQQDMMVSRGNKTKNIDSEDEASDDSLDTCQQNRNFRRRKSADSLDREDDFSDDLVSDVVSKKKKQRRVRDASEDSMDECSRKKPKALTERKGPKFLGIKDAVSDDFPGFLTYQRRRKAKISKEHLIKSEETPLPEGHRYQQSVKTKAKSFNTELFPDSMPLTSHQQLSRSKGKQIEFLGSEEADSDDSSEDDSDQQCGRACKIKLPKSTSLLKVKRRTTKQVKIGTCKLIKETPRVFKPEKQVKQETAQLRKNRSEQCSEQFDSPDEEDLEDGPNTRLRKRPSKTPKQLPTRPKDSQKTSRKQSKTCAGLRAPASQKKGIIKDEDAEYVCNLDGCSMSFSSKQELVLHKRNVCPVKGCGKKFFSHKYLVQHRRVHSDDRPLKCPWKGCKMTFKWAWARTEHIRVHTGARPYVCAEEGCGQTFRFVSDFSRHKRKTGHSVKKASGSSSKV